ncbi:peptide deformylase [Candidatus Sumerlaeota bacterium]|nr:peptide deformylase [Candidatus Sumerlaeota bacterium]
MANLKVARLGHPVLRELSRPVEPQELQSDEIQRLIDDMIETMREQDGVGLAAPQVHCPLRLVVYEILPENPRYPKAGECGLRVLVNPKVEPLGEELELDWEGCLSIPGLRGVVPRAMRVKVEALDRQGQPVSFEAERFESRVVQHEIDHLNGIVYLDRMADLQTLCYQEECMRHWIVDEEDDDEEAEEPHMERSVAEE